MNPVGGEDSELFLDLLGIVADVVEDLDGHVAIALPVKCLVHLAERTLTD